jgi:circadian clock protein KaiB
MQDDAYGKDIGEINLSAKIVEAVSVKLKLYVSGTSPKSAKAIAYVRGICEEHLQGRYDLEVIDLYQRPDLAAKEKVVAVPTLIREVPEPILRMVGDFADDDQLLYSLNIHDSAK